MLDRRTLLPECVSKDIFEIEFCDFRISEEASRSHGIIMFIDLDGATKLLKNKYGAQGMVQAS